MNLFCIVEVENCFFVLFMKNGAVFCLDSDLYMLNRGKKENVFILNGEQG